MFSREDEGSILREKNPLLGNGKRGPGNQVGLQTLHHWRQTSIKNDFSFLVVLCPPASMWEIELGDFFFF